MPRLLTTLPLLLALSPLPGLAADELPIAPATMDHSVMDHAAHMAQMQRQADVASRGAAVMPFSLPATLHLFRNTPTGGIQQVIARQVGDSEQIRLIRQHLQDIRQRFAHGDFGAPSQIHGHDMPGLAALRAATPGGLTIRYSELPAGAQLEFSSNDPALTAAIQQWFTAQLADHGKDASATH